MGVRAAATGSCQRDEPLRRQGLELRAVEVGPQGTQATARVLVIDDSNTIRRSAEIFLKQGGYEVALAEDGFDALSKAGRLPPRPGFLRHLDAAPGWLSNLRHHQAQSAFAAVPVIMLSSKDGLFDKARGRMVGSQDYLTKPFTKDQLLQAVRQHRPEDRLRDRHDHP